MIEILPLIFDYLNNPLQLVQVSKYVNNVSKRCRLSFGDEYCSDLIDEYQFNYLLFGIYRWRQIVLSEDIYFRMTYKEFRMMPHLEYLQLDNYDYRITDGDLK